MPPVPLDHLLAHRAWVRRIARALMRDESRAQDLEQEVWRKAIARPPRDRGGLRGWLGTVLRRAASDQRRSEDRRSRHEKAAASPGTFPDVADLVAEAESHRRVVTAVMALAEPARSTVLLRYFEDLPPGEVARRLGVPVETVRTRLKRALPILRSRLDAEHGGDGTSWILALAPLGGAPATSPGPAALSATKLGALIMGTKTKV
ncbi:MAG: RNA polymerase sigma factor, partial [Planctomycetota bacterium]